MLTTGLFTKHRNFALALLAALVVVAGTVAWWQFSRGGLTSAQERIADICASAVYPDSFDMVDRITHFEGDESGTAEYDVRVDGNKHHYLLSIRGTLAYETVLVFPDTTTGSSSNSGRSANSNQGTAYVREFSSGEWQDWNVTTGDAGGQSGTGQTSSGASRSADGEDYESFCGLALELPGQEVEFRYVGNETVNGVSTGHYFHKYSPGGVGDYVSTEYWLDADGLLRQVRTVWYGPPAPGSPESRLEHFKTYSGWGEPNVITVPGAGSPVPNPTATSIPPPTSTPAPTWWAELSPIPVSVSVGTDASMTVSTNVAAGVMVRISYQDSNGDVPVDCGPYEGGFALRPDGSAVSVVACAVGVLTLTVELSDGQLLNSYEIPMVE